MENTDPRTFTNVRVFAGDKFKPAADASYRNFDAGPSFKIGSNVRRNNQIGTIGSWGPLFRISMELIIHSHVQDDWSNVISFKGNGETSNYGTIGDRIPAILLSKPHSMLKITNTVDRNSDYHFYFKIELNHWYNIIIEQKSVNGKVINFYLNTFL